MTKRDRELMVEAVLKRWKRLQAEVKDAEDEAANIAFSQGSGDPVQSSSISDKTARGAAVLESVAEKRAWVECVTAAMEWLHEEQPDLERLLYGHYGMRHLRGYKRTRARSFAESYCRVFHISMPEYHRRRVDALNEVAFNATEAGLLHSHTERGKTVL